MNKLDAIKTPIVPGHFVIRKTTVGRYEVSTCAGGLVPDGTAETMVFDNENGDTDVMPGYTRRHTWLEDAVAWHEEVVAKIAAAWEA